MDSPLVLEIAKQVPSLVVLVLLVWKFITDSRSRDEAMLKVIEQNTLALGRVGETLDSNRQSTADAVRDGLAGFKCPAVAGSK